MSPLPPLTALHETRRARLMRGCRFDDIQLNGLLPLPAHLRDAEAIKPPTPHHASGQHNLRKAFTPAKT